MAGATFRSTPKLIGGYLSYATKMPIGEFWHTIAVDSPDWQKFLTSEHKVFSYEDTITVRRETRKRGTAYWVAYKRIDHDLRKKYLGTADKVTAESLRQAYEYFAGLEKNVPWYRRTLKEPTTAANGE